MSPPHPEWNHCGKELTAWSLRSLHKNVWFPTANPTVTWTAVNNKIRRSCPSRDFSPCWLVLFLQLCSKEYFQRTLPSTGFPYPQRGRPGYLALGAGHEILLSPSRESHLDICRMADSSTWKRLSHIHLVLTCSYRNSYFYYSRCSSFVVVMFHKLAANTELANTELLERQG